MRVRITSTSSTPSVLDGQEFNRPYTEILDGRFYDPMQMSNRFPMAMQVKGRVQNFIDNKDLTWTIEIIKNSGEVICSREKPSAQQAEKMIKNFSKPH